MYLRVRCDNNRKHAHGIDEWNTNLSKLFAAMLVVVHKLRETRRMKILKNVLEDLGSSTRHLNYLTTRVNLLLDTVFPEKLFLVYYQRRNSYRTCHTLRLMHYNYILRRHFPTSALIGIIIRNNFTELRFDETRFTNL